MNKKIPKALRKNFTAFRDLGSPLCEICYAEIADNPKVVKLYPGGIKMIVCLDCFRGLQKDIKEIKGGK